MATMFLITTLIHGSMAAPSVAGWRGDGTGVWNDAAPAHELRIRWQTEVGTSLASPVLVEGLVCTLAEPADLLCLDADTGALAWRRTADIASTRPAEEREAWRAQEAGWDGLADRMVALQRDYGKLRREARHNPTGDTASRLGVLAAELEAAQLELDAIEPYRTSVPRRMIGYAAATPVTDGEVLYAVFGHGIVAAHDLSGTWLWSTWLGAAVPPMRGWHEGTAASPLLVDGVLVVGFNQLTGLDPATGEVKWRSVPYQDFGSPVAATVAGEGVVLTPAGQMVRARDGEVLHEHLGGGIFVGPVVQGDVLYSVLQPPAGNDGTPPNLGMAAFRLSDGTELWRQEWPFADQMYGSPLVTGGLVYAVSSNGHLLQANAATGAITAHERLLPLDSEERVYWASPAAAGGRVHLWGKDGRALSIDPASPANPATVLEVEEQFIASPVFADDRIYARGETALWCLDGGP